MTSVSTEPDPNVQIFWKVRVEMDVEAERPNWAAHVWKTRFLLSVIPATPGAKFSSRESILTSG